MSFNGIISSAPLVTQKGGRLLGQGVYGCTFSPVPRCAGGKVFREVGGLPAVGKVTTDDPAAEVGVGRTIMGLPLAAQYFALPTETCGVTLPLEDPDADACKVIKEPGVRASDLTLLVMPAGGEALRKWSGDKARMAANYKRIFIHLLEGMLIYQDAGYVHNDIHDGNVVVDGRAVARYIDFGLAFRVKDVREWEDANLGRKFRPKYFWQAPEVHLARMLMNGVSVEEGVRQLKEISPEYERIEHQYPSRPTMTQAFMALATQSRSMVEKDWGKFARTYALAFDWWRVGLLMWDIWDNLLPWSGLRETALWKERDLVRTVLGGMTAFDPRKRMPAAEALRLLDPTNRMLR